MMVQRWEQRWAEMWKEPYGEYVLFTDYERAVAEAVEEDRKRWSQPSMYEEGYNDGYHAGIDSEREACRQVAEQFGYQHNVDALIDLAKTADRQAFLQGVQDERERIRRSVTVMRNSMIDGPWKEALTTILIFVIGDES